MKKTYRVFSILCTAYILTTPIEVLGLQVGIIGGGGSGLTTAWLLDQDCEVTLFEKADRLGGRANTIDVQIEGRTTPIEAGFEFISEGQFPYFCRLLNQLQIPLNRFTLTTTFYNTDGSEVLILPPFHDGMIEWESLTPHDVFEMIQINSLLNDAKRLIETVDSGITFEDFVESLSLTSNFKEELLYPFIAAGWGVTKEDIKEFVAYDALKYVVKGKEEEDYKWVEVKGGTKKYIQALVSQLQHTKIKLETRIAKILYEDGRYIVVEENGDVSYFDHLVIATNAKQASSLLDGITFAYGIQSILKNIEYFKITIAIHGDIRFMPPDHQDWTVVNIRYDGKNSAATVYKKWLSPTFPIFKSWITFDVRSPKDSGPPLPNPLYALVHYDHPKANLKYFQVQKAIEMIQGNHHLWFAGNYTHDNDSHESAIVSAINVVKKITPDSRRLASLLKD